VVLVLLCGVAVLRPYCIVSENTEQAFVVHRSAIFSVFHTTTTTTRTKNTTHL